MLLCCLLFPDFEFFFGETIAHIFLGRMDYLVWHFPTALAVKKKREGNGDGGAGGGARGGWARYFGLAYF